MDLPLEGIKVIELGIWALGPMWAFPFSTVLIARWVIDHPLLKRKCQ